MNNNLLRPFWQKYFSYDWKFGIFLILLFGIPRFILVLQTAASGGYGFVSLIFVLMWFTPFIFLSKEGRKYIGFTKPSKSQWIMLSFFLGMFFCAALFILNTEAYGIDIKNSFYYISRSYTVPREALLHNRMAVFIPIAITSMIFSPFGEEFLYRGVIHGSFAQQLGERRASYVDSLAFALTHLAHFGIVFYNGQWDFLPLQATIWVAAMFVLSQVLFICRQKGGSIWCAVLCHAGFNLAMTYFILYHIL
ncbi:CPBP family intramembrane glutamic endopeptidase [Dysgonomonas macrotermitis]|uniref:CAAX prenyl protease 2/Lysostaphin resistance protein A-like domain-containing protein n=1 Tax=Dysgonomonas macrotermitis TaxID=1346286 RepID=A0A1M5HKG2_9BACT|nr:type II CAAX endopeptidase family protein [Dysgonomonas macrotermitis]SHG16425.1 hypothetical protein SAMN05444362_11693 [Dysgonomonas macrotermitis]